LWARHPSPTFLQRRTGGSDFLGEGEVILGLLAETKQSVEKLGWPWLMLGPPTPESVALSTPTFPLNLVFFPQNSCPPPHFLARAFCGVSESAASGGEGCVISWGWCGHPHPQLWWRRWHLPWLYGDALSLAMVKAGYLAGLFWGCPCPQPG